MQFLFILREIQALTSVWFYLEMSEIRNKKSILEIIDLLRSRKSRPDINRICKFMLKTFKVSPKDTKSDLRKCLHENSVIKVDYKGNVSYRNAIKWRNQSSKMSLTASNERRIITSAIATLIYQDQSFLENGIPFEELVKAAISQETKYSKKHLEIIIHKELSSGSLVKLPNGNLALGPVDNEADSPDSFKFEYNADSNTKMTSSANSSCRSSPLRTRGRPRKRGGATGSASSHSTSTRNTAADRRVGERRKMAKKVFDPSENNIPNKKKRGRPAGSLNKNSNKKQNNNKNDKESPPQSESQHSSAEDDTEMNSTAESSGGVCSVCHIQKSRGSNDKLVECRDCSNKAHMNCLLTASGILKIRPDNTWQCPHCKTCVVCCETNDAGVLTVCTVCSDAYHSLCHAPRIPERLKAWDQWECNNCLQSRPGAVTSPAINKSIYSKEQLPSSEPFIKQSELDLKPGKEEALQDESIPDVANWNTNEVYEYFKLHFPEIASVLRDQEFDGSALLMARRADIVRGLGLDLGPALALYRIIVKLQTRIDDWTMCWG